MTAQLLPLIQSGSVADLTEELEARGVRYALASFVDMHGVCKAKAVPIDHLGAMAAGSELFTGAAVDGVPQDVSDDEVAALPDLSSATVLPWRPDTVWFASSLQLAGQPFEACSRNILCRVRDQATRLGLRFQLGVETEFFVLRRAADGSLQPASAADQLDKPCYDLRGLLDNLDWLDELVQAMNGLGWGVYSFDHEDGNGQFETDFNYADGLVTADRITFFRLMAREITRRHGLIASFMPKPFADRTGSGAHFNMSLADLESGVNLFTPEDGRLGWVSELGRQFIAGILRHACNCILRRRCGQPVRPREKSEECPYREIEIERRALREIAKRSLGCAARCDDGRPADLRIACVRLEKARDHSQGRRFARAIRPEEGHRLPCRNGKAHSAHGLAPTERLGKTGDLQRLHDIHQPGRGRDTAHGLSRGPILRRLELNSRT